MNLYELTYILRPDLEDEGLTDTQERVNARVTDAGGELVKSESWGKRRLAYSIDGAREGTYITSILRLPGDTVRGIENQLKLIPGVLRFLVIRQEARNINLEGSLLPSVPSRSAAPPTARAEGEESGAATMGPEQAPAEGEAAASSAEAEQAPLDVSEAATANTEADAPADGGAPQAETREETSITEPAEDEPESLDASESAGQEPEKSASNEEAAEPETSETADVAAGDTVGEEVTETADDESAEETEA